MKNSDFGSELEVSRDPKHHLWYFAFKTATLAPEIQVYMGPLPHL